MDLSKSLKRFRKEFKITQKQAAASAGIEERSYQDYEYGRTVPLITAIVSLADAFGVSVDYLLGRTDNPYVNK